ncbi:hypothetical protein [Floridanema aerugineum]|jgi:hypothetical protein|uniref:Uncharacterized protein n=1 Tax=Floridaenema aerugineum BLCC-F46 TaxID=3153654 RepID=A0ABV4X010_9CYAN
MNYLQLEEEISKLTTALMTRHREIISDLIVSLKAQLSLEEVAGIVLVSLERLLWFDIDLFFWCLENLIPKEIKNEIKRIIAVTNYKQLIAKGLIPGQDFSMDGDGKLLQNPCRRTH